MKDILIVIDMQNDFISGALGTKEAQAIVPRVVNKVKEFTGDVYFTRDTHDQDYLHTQEGRKLPVPHCVRGSAGWEICRELETLDRKGVFDKPGFGSVELARAMAELAGAEDIGSITLVGLCTDICVISNAMLLKAFLPETEIVVDASCCAGVTPVSHRNALKAMKYCQITVVNEEPTV